MTEDGISLVNGSHPKGPIWQGLWQRMFGPKLRTAALETMEIEMPDMAAQMNKINKIVNALLVAKHEMEQTIACEGVWFGGPRDGSYNPVQVVDEALAEIGKIFTQLHDAEVMASYPPEKWKE